MRYRTGRKVGRTIYCKINGEEALIGMMDSVELAEFFVKAANYYLDRMSGETGS